MSQLAEALFTITQQKVLGLLYSLPENSFYTNEILRLMEMGVATITREVRITRARYKWHLLKPETIVFTV